MKRVLLTGASGFVGSHVLRHLLVNTDWEIVCPVTYTHKGMQDRIRSACDGERNENYFNRVKVVRCDLTAPITAVTAHEFGNIDYVLNVASESHVDRSIDTPTPFILNNVALICHLLDWAREYKPEKIIQISTDEVYGPAYDDYAHQEWIDQHLPSNPYSASKAAQEDIAFSYWRTYGIPLVITNTMNIIGQMQDPEKFVPMLVKKIYNGETVTIHGSSDESNIGSRYYLHARNQADGLLYILNNSNFCKYGDSLKPERFHIVGEKEVNNLEMAKMIAEIMGKPLKYEMVDFHKTRPGHDLRYALDGSKLADAGWKAPIKFEESLETTVKWTLDNPQWMKI